MFALLSPKLEEMYIQLQIPKITPLKEHKTSDIVITQYKREYVFSVDTQLKVLEPKPILISSCCFSRFLEIVFIEALPDVLLFIIAALLFFECVIMLIFDANELLKILTLEIIYSTSLFIFVSKSKKHYTLQLLLIQEFKSGVWPINIIQCLILGNQLGKHVHIFRKTYHLYNINEY